MADGTVYDLMGNERGKTADVEAVFLAAVERASELEGGAVYVVMGADHPEGFEAKIRELCPVVRDDQIKDAAVILAGTPDEWEEFRDQPELIAQVLDAATGGAR
jgi:hypothetical protein